MFIAILTLLSALSISGVAIFYSVIGLATIFPGAFWPVVIMGSVLEVGKLVTASWLYRNWQHTKFLLKMYLTIAVVVLIAITSMGIFGFLSKAHLEQNLAENTVNQRIEIINGKISSQNTYIKRQQLVIERAEQTLKRTNTSNTDAIDIEKQSLKDVQDKFKTLLAVETNAVKELNARMKILDKDVSDVLTANKQFFNEEKAAAELKASQKEERDLINIKISEAQKRIELLKEDYVKDTNDITVRIDKLREGSSDDKSDVYKQIEQAEANILTAQNTIDQLVVEKEPLESQMIKLEAEVGPIKYIAALVVDWGVTSEVNTSEAVRWVILVIICVFDPLAVLLLVAANQSFLRRFPVKAPKPQKIIDLEKPDDEDITLKWNEMMAKANAQAKMEKATNQLKEWKNKLDAFNSKVETPKEKPVEIIQENDANDSDWGDGIVVPEKKTEDKKIVVDNLKDGFDPSEVEGYEEFNANYETKNLSQELQEDLEPLPGQRIKPDLTEVIEPETTTVEEALKMPESESVEKPIKKPKIGMLGTITVDDRTKKPVTPPKPETPTPEEMTEFERTGMLNKFHQEHGKFEDISDDQLKMERDQSNRAQYLADVSLTKEEAEAQPAITESRMAFFQDMIDDILRGDTTFENVPEENRKIIAQIMDPEMPDPQIITKQSALKDQHPEGIEEMSAEGLKEKFMAQPKTEERPMTDEELDELLAGWEEDHKPSGKTKMIIKDGKKVFVPDEDYVQNEEQDETTMWNKTQELNLPEPEKNELDLPPLENTIEEENIPDMVEDIKIEKVIPQNKFETHKKRLTTDEDYRQRIEARINDLITKVESGELKLEDLTQEDQKVIIDIMNQNG